jgi:hypothetical protein
MRARGTAPARREILGALALLLVLALWCPRSQGQGAAPKMSAADDLTVLRSVFPANQPVTIRLRSVPPGQPEQISGVRIVDVVELLGTRFLRLQGPTGEKILLRSAQIYSVETGVAAGAPKAGKRSFTLFGPGAVNGVQGASFGFKAVVNRKEGFKDEIRITVEALPPGVKVDPREVTLRPGDQEAAFRLNISQDAKLGETDFTLRAVGGGVKAEARVMLLVEKKR